MQFDAQIQKLLFGDSGKTGVHEALEQRTPDKGNTTRSILDARSVSMPELRLIVVNRYTAYTVFILHY